MHVGRMLNREEMRRLEAVVRPIRLGVYLPRWAGGVRPCPSNNSSVSVRVG